MSNLVTMANGDPEMSSLKNDLSNCTNENCLSDSDYVDMILDYIKPVFYEWILIVMHILVFITGLIGNLLVCVAVYRNRSMRTVVNYFLVNLAVADFLVLIVCLPPSVLWDITETWFFGRWMCKIILYLQNVSVTVSVLTLAVISVDRWYAICHPLKPRLTTRKTLHSILIIWIVAFISDIPELISLELKGKLANSNLIYFTQCEPIWSKEFDTVWISIRMILLYFIPLCFMSVAYVKIIRNLSKSSDMELNLNTGYFWTTFSIQISLIFHYFAKWLPSFAQLWQKIHVSKQSILLKVYDYNDIRTKSRRKAAKMLIYVVVMFAICYFPVHLFSLVRLVIRVPQNDINTAIALFVHWLCYANSAINPIIYNIMNSKYRNEFNTLLHSSCNLKSNQAAE